MKKPVLVVMAAGMGSRYGGLKQIDPVLKRARRFYELFVLTESRISLVRVLLDLPVIKKSNLNLLTQP